MNPNENPHLPNTRSSRRSALLAGTCSLVMFVAALVAEMLARQSLIVEGDSAQTAVNLLSRQGLFRTGLFCFLLVLACDVLVAGGLYAFMKRVDPLLSWLAAAFRLVYTAVFAVAVAELWKGFRLLTHSARANSVQEQAMAHFRAFDDTWAIGLLLFGLHLLLIAILILRSADVPNLVGILLLLASLAYMADNLAKLLLSDYAQAKFGLTMLVAVPSILGELGLALWLLFRGGKRFA